MRRILPADLPLKISGFNNLTKCLSFNLYDFCAARNESERHAYRSYIQAEYHAKKITSILQGICSIMEAKIIAVSDQDYEPWGASSMVLMSDLKGSGTYMHLDKSHICAHTYPDFVENGQICSFRIDIDIATCGEISPLKALNFMFDHFCSDVVVVDYVVRGFARDTSGNRIYIDHPIGSIQDFIAPKILRDYRCIDISLQSDNIWQTKMLRTNLDVASYFLNGADVTSEATQSLMRSIKSEMRAVVHMWPD